ncbi:MAG: DUF4062 domain-containing protein [Pseudomonadota bacterium]
MRKKKYQIFISSTYEDLKEERKAVEETIIRAGDLPVGMEAFPAADEEQFEFIKSVIDDCDYYVIIVGGRYGSLDHDGVSYTEKEYDYAAKIGLPVIALVHGDPGSLPASKVEASETGREKLGAFLKKLTEKRLRKEWRSTDGLKLAVREAIDHAKATKARPGWVRGTELAAEEAMTKIIALESEVRNLRYENSKFEDLYTDAKAEVSQAGLDGLAQLDDIFDLVIDSDGRMVNLKFTWGELFTFLVPIIRLRTNYGDLRFRICRVISEHRKLNLYEYASISAIDFETIVEHFCALRLLETESAKGNHALSITKLGGKTYTELKAVRKP